MNLIERIAAVHQALEQSKLNHAFGGALALAWCTQQARATIDIDVNVFVDVAESENVLKQLPDGTTWTGENLEVLKRDGQVRVWFDTTPLDIFLNTTDYHDQLLQRIHFAPLGDQTLPFLSCLDLAVFKAFFDRTKDWADLEAMAEAGTLDIEQVSEIIQQYLGDDSRLGKLADLAKFQPT
jgi:hypothetical protein